MKKIFFVLVIFAVNKLSAQNIFPTVGSVGINKTTNLRSELDVNGRVSSTADFYTTVMFPANFAVGDYIEFVKTDPDMAGTSGNYEISIAYTRGNIAASATYLASVSHFNPAIWREAGKVNSNPYAQTASECFAIDCNTEYGNARFRIRATNVFGSLSEPMYVTIKVRSINANLGWQALNVAGNDASVTKLQPMTNEWNLYVGNPFLTDGANIAIKAISNGNVGIGTANPTEKLSVDGTIKTRKVVVIQTGWADYVFAPSYKLPSLDSVATFIQTNKHLPDIPSEKEVQEEGHDLGEMQKLLLKKVEELTLYVIELKKKNDNLETENTDLKKRMQVVEQRTRQ